MKRLLSLLPLLFVLISCNDDDPCGGVIPDVLTQFLYIELVDANGTNLIQNGTYAPTDIFTERNGDRFQAVVFTENEDFIAPELQYRIEIGIVGNPGDNNLWSIELNDTETDILRLDLSIESQGCNGRFYQINEIQYNNAETPVQDLGDNRFEITIVK